MTEKESGKTLASAFSLIVKKVLLSKSLPYQAHKKNDPKGLKRHV